MKDSWRKVVVKYDELTAVLPTYQILETINDKRKIYEEFLKIFPSNENIFKCFEFCEISDIKVVIIGQDPYHGPNQATGLCFAVNNGIVVPPSLRNIINELKTDLDINLTNVSLEHWALQGVLLLNSSLSVLQGQAGSQMKLWCEFTDYVISELNKQNNIIFVAWGAFAHNKLNNIDINKHKMIVSSHPSPLSYYKNYKQFPPFKNSRPFSRINNLLKENGKDIILWG